MQASGIRVQQCQSWLESSSIPHDTISAERERDVSACSPNIDSEFTSEHLDEIKIIVFYQNFLYKPIVTVIELGMINF